MDAQNIRARSIAEAVDADDLDRAVALRSQEAPLRVLNELLRLSTIPIEISVRSNEELVASKDGSDLYSIAELSDGERSVLLLAANVLTATPGTLLLIDEPERHIHRSISSQLLSLLMARRSDCSFVVSTHDVMLCLDTPLAKVLLVRSCSRSSSEDIAWDADLLTTTPDLDESLYGEILGARRQVLFVEGTRTSLDLPLYSLLFPKASVIPKKSCRDVEQAVIGVRSASGLHRIQAFGIVDRDGRVAEDVARLEGSGVFPLATFSVEALYFGQPLIRAVAMRLAAVTGEDIDQVLADARTAALASLMNHKQRLCERAAEKSIRDIFLRRQPGRDEIAASVPYSVSIDVPDIVGRELARFQSLHDAADLPALIQRYPVRETQALSEITKRLGFQSRAKYCTAARKLLTEDAAVLAILRSSFGNLIRELH